MADENPIAPPISDADAPVLPPAPVATDKPAPAPAVPVPPVPASTPDAAPVAPFGSQPAPIRSAGGFDAPEPTKAPNAADTIGAAFRHENDVVAGIGYLMSQREFPADKTYNPFTGDKALEGKYLDEYGDRFVGSRSAQQSQSIRTRIDQELADARLIESAGVWGTVASMAAGILSPTSILPGGEVYKGARAGERAVRTGLSVGKAAAGATALQETILHASQETRTTGESALNVGGSALLGAFLGSAIGKFTAPPHVIDRMADDLAGITPNPEQRLYTPGVGTVRDLANSIQSERVAELAKRVDEARVSIDEAEARHQESAANHAKISAETGVSGPVDVIRAVPDGVIEGESIFRWGMQFENNKTALPHGLSPEEIQSLQDLGLADDRGRISFETYQKLNDERVRRAAGGAQESFDQAKAQRQAETAAKEVEYAKQSLTTAEELHKIVSETIDTSPYAAGGAQSAGAAAAVVADTRLKLSPIDPAVRNVTYAVNWARRKVANTARQVVGAVPNEAPIVGSTLAEVSSFMTPLLHAQTRDIAATRRGVAALADPAGARLVAHTEEGGHVAVVPGGSVEVRAHAQIDSIEARYAQEMERIYADYWKSVGGSEGVSGKVGIAMNAAKQATVGGDGPLSPSQFFELVGRSIRVDDAANADPFVKQAAARQKYWQDHVLNLLPDDLKPDISGGPKFAGGYLPKIFNSKAVAAKAPELEETIYRNMVGDQERKSLLQGEAGGARTEMEGMDKRQGQIEGRLETARRRQADIQSRVAEMSSASRRGQARLEAADVQVHQIEQDMASLESEITAARADRDYNKADLANLEKELTSLRRDRDAVLRKSAKQPDGAPVSYDEIPAGPTAGTFVDYVSGKRGRPRAQSTVNWIVQSGGIKPDADIAQLFDGKPPRGLFKADGKTLEELGHAYADHVGIPNYLEGTHGYRFEKQEMIDAIEASLHGKESPAWRNTYSDELHRRMELYDAAQDTADAMHRAGLDPTNRAQVLSFIKGENPAEAIGKPVGQQLGSVEDAGRMADDGFEDIPIDPVENYRGMDELAAGVQGNVKRAESIISNLRGKIEARDKAGAKQAGRQGEALANAKAARNRMDALLDRLEIYAGTDKNLSDELAALTKSKEDVRGRLERIVSDWEGDTTRAARKALENRAKQAEERQKKMDAGEYNGRGERLRVADDPVDAAIDSILKGDRNKSDAELRTQAREVVMNLMSSPEGRLPYEWGETASKQSRAAMQSGNKDEVNIPFLKERRFPVHDEELLDVLNNDVRQVFHAYLHSMVPQAEMHRMFGDIRGTSVIRDIQEEYGQRIAGSADEAERMQLKTDMDADVHKFGSMRDRILGVYALPDNPESLFYRGASIMRSMNFLSKMGMMVPSSLADAGGIVMRHGLGNTFDALGGALARFSKDTELFAIAKAERDILDDSGVGLEYVLGSRAMSFAEIANDYGRGSKFERGLQTVTDAYSYVNLARQWDSSVQTVAGIASLRRIMRNSEAWAKGPIAPGEAEFMAQLNLGQDQARRIWQASQAGEGERIKGVFIPEGRTWADKEAYDSMRFALRQSVDSTLIKPGQDKPLWMSTPTGKVIGQFRSFIIAAQQRILLAGLQQSDAAAAQGLVTMLSLGTLSVVLSDLARDGKLKDRTPGEWFVEGYDRSGTAGWLMEGNNVAEKISGQNFGLRPMAGQQPAARSLNQSKADAILGPTLGLVSDATRLAGFPFRQQEITRGDVRVIRNQIPGQNLFWARSIFNAIHESAEKGLGIYEPPKKH